MFCGICAANSNRINKPTKGGWGYSKKTKW